MSWAGPRDAPPDSVAALAHAAGKVRTQGQAENPGPLGAVLGVWKVTSQPGSGPSLWPLFPLGYDLTSSILPGRWVGPKGVRKVPFIIMAVTFGEHYSPIVCGPSQFFPSGRKAVLSR